MLTSKQRAALRGKASCADPVFQMGKDGVTDGFLNSVDQALNARELIKVTVLKTAPLDPREAGEEIASKVRAELVAAIGGKIILYRYSKTVTNHVLEVK